MEKSLAEKKAQRFLDPHKRQVLRNISQKVWTYNPQLTGLEVVAVLILVPSDHPSWPVVERELKEEAAFWGEELLEIYRKAVATHWIDIQHLAVFCLLENGNYTVIYFAPEGGVPSA